MGSAMLTNLIKETNHFFANLHFANLNSIISAKASILVLTRVLKAKESTNFSKFLANFKSQALVLFDFF